jgi:hypothetical protein
MTLTIDLPDEEVQALAAMAHAQGVSPEQHVRLVLEQNLPITGARKSVSQSIREIWSDMPADVQVKLPHDGASQIDH